MKRAWAGSGFFSLLKIVAALGGSLFTREKISEEQLEELKSRDVLTAALSELSAILPGVKRSLIDERDRYMAAKILCAPGNDILAVVGAGHVPGIIRHLAAGQLDVSDIDRVDSHSRYLGKVFNYFLLLLGISVIAGLIYFIGVKNTFIAFGTWTVVNGLFAAGAAALCMAHPFTIIITFFASPVAAIHPGFAVGWVSALVEAYLRNPRVQDFEELIESEKFRWRLLNNRVARILLLLILPNLGSILGTAVAIYVLSSAAPS
jgi:pheromone shutdown-related protein TraB